MALDTSKVEAPTVSLGNLLKCPTTLRIHFFLIPNLNMLTFDLKPFPLVLSLQALKNNLAPSFLLSSLQQL